VGALGSILGWEDPLEEGKATHSNILQFFPGEFYGLRSLMGHSPWGHRVGQDLATMHSTVYIYIYSFPFEPPSHPTLQPTLLGHQRAPS